MSAIYGYNVYVLDSYPRYPIFCPTYEAVEALIKGDDEHYYVRVRRDPEDDSCLEDENI